MPNKPKRQNDRDVKIAHTIWGVILGAFTGATAGLGLCVYVIPGTLLFPGDTIVFGALAFAYFGYRYGEDFFDWLNENWWWLP